MALADFVSDVLNWWPAELARAFGRGGRCEAASGAVLRLSRAGTEIAVEGFETQIATDPGQIVPYLDAALKGRRADPTVTILIATERHLKRRLAPIRLPRSRRNAMALMDLQASTPFDPAQFFIFTPAFDEGITDSSYYTVRKSILVPIVEALRTGRYQVRSIQVEDDAKLVAIDGDGLRAVQGRSAASRLGERATRIGLATAAAGLVAILVAGHWRYAVAADRVGAEVEAAEAQVRQLRAVLAARDAKIAQIGAVRDEKKSRIPMVSIVEEMARAVPDNTFLTELSVSGDMVRFAGVSSSAAALIPVLEASPLFSAPTFMEPVVRAIDQSGERFSIAMKLENGDG